MAFLTVIMKSEWYGSLLFLIQHPLKSLIEFAFLWKKYKIIEKIQSRRKKKRQARYGRKKNL